MVTQETTVFDAISDPTRRAILDTLSRKEIAAGDIARLFPVSRPAISRHIRVLRGAGLINERRVRQCRMYSLNPAPLRKVERWLEHYRGFWAGRLMDLKHYAEAQHTKRGAT